MIVAGPFNITKRKGRGVLFNSLLSKFFQRKKAWVYIKLPSLKLSKNKRSAFVIKLRKFGLEEVHASYCAGMVVRNNKKYK